MSIAAVMNGDYDTTEVHEQYPQVSQEQKVTRGDSVSLLPDEVISRVTTTIADNLDIHVSQVQSTTRMGKDLDIDEYDLVSLLMRLEFDFGIQFADEELYLSEAEQMTVQDIMDCVIRKLSL